MEVQNVVVVSLNQVGVFIEDARDLNTGHLLANVVRQDATRLCDLCGFVKIGVGDDLAKSERSGKYVFSFLASVCRNGSR